MTSEDTVQSFYPLILKVRDENKPLLGSFSSIVDESSMMGVIGRQGPQTHREARQQCLTGKGRHIYALCYQTKSKTF